MYGCDSGNLPCENNFGPTDKSSASINCKTLLISEELVFLN